MNPILKMYLKTGVISGLVFGGLMSISELMKGHEFQVRYFLMSAIPFAALSLLFVYFHIRKLKKAGVKDLTDSAINVTQKTNLLSKQI